MLAEEEKKKKKKKKESLYQEKKMSQHQSWHFKTQRASVPVDSAVVDKAQASPTTPFFVAHGEGKGE